MICENCGKEIKENTSYISLDEFAKRLGVSRTSIERQIRTGRIRAFELGGNSERAGRVLIPESEFEIFVKNSLKPVGR